MGKIEGTYEKIRLDLQKHVLKEIEVQGDVVSSDFSEGSVILHTHQDEILLEEGFLREIVRKIQSLRKEMGLQKSQQISLSFEGSDEYFHELIDNWQNYLCKKVGASEILQKHVDKPYEYEIKGRKIQISIKK